MDNSGCDEPALLPLAEALARMLGQVKAISETETVSLGNSLDRILAESVRSSIAVPAQTNSAMDGYALRAVDAQLNQPLRVIGKSLAGHPFNTEVTIGTCVRITTGAPVPAGADCVIMQENVDVKDDVVILRQIPALQENIRQRGEDIAEGDVILHQGTRIGPLEISLLASIGSAGINVFRRPRVAVLSTGDELVAPGETLLPGQIYDSNRYGIIAFLQRLGVDVFDVGLIRDQPAALRAALQRASEHADAVISSGGVSVGEADLVKDILGQQGDIHFWKVAIKPGKPFAFGRLGKSHFFGLPGNPVSAMVTLHQLVLPVLQQMSGAQVPSSATIQATAATRFNKRPGRVDFQRACLTHIDGKNIVRHNGPQGSGVMTSFSGANCYVVLERERGSVTEGEVVNVVPFDRFIG